MKVKNWAALVALLLTIAVAAIVAGCGSDDNSATSSGKTAGNPTDRAFVADMIPHHRSAVEMAAVAKSEATSRFVTDLAADITRTQNAEIAQMKRVDAQLAKAGIDKGDLGVDEHAMGMDADADQLRRAKPFDEEFIAMMVPHHEGAIEMARVEIEKGENSELKKLAEDIISAQEREIRQMRAHAKGETGGAHGGSSGGHSG